MAKAKKGKNGKARRGNGVEKKVNILKPFGMARVLSGVAIKHELEKSGRGKEFRV